MTEILQALAPWISPAVLIIQILVSFFVLLMSRKFTTKEEHKATKDKVERLDAEVTDHTHRLRRVEEELDDLPDAAALHKLSIQITQLEGKLQTFGARFDSVKVLGDRMQKQIDMMDEFLKRGVNR